MHHVYFKDADNKLVYTVVRPGGRITPNRRKRGNNNSGRRVTVDLERLKAEGILRIWILAPNPAPNLSSPTTMPKSTLGKMATTTFTDTVLLAAAKTIPG